MIELTEGRQTAGGSSSLRLSPSGSYGRVSSQALFAASCSPSDDLCNWLTKINLLVKILRLPD